MSISCCEERDMCNDCRKAFCDGGAVDGQCVSRLYEGQGCPFAHIEDRPYYVKQVAVYRFKDIIDGVRIFISDREYWGVHANYQRPEWNDLGEGVMCEVNSKWEDVPENVRRQFMVAYHKRLREQQRVKEKENPTTITMSEEDALTFSREKATIERFRADQQYYHDQIKGYRKNIAGMEDQITRNLAAIGGIEQMIKKLQEPEMVKITIPAGRHIEIHVKRPGELQSLKMPVELCASPRVLEVPKGSMVSTRTLHEYNETGEINKL